MFIRWIRVDIRLYVEYAWIYVYTLNTRGYTFIRWIRVDIRLYVEYAWIYVYTLNTHGYTFIRWIRMDIRLYVEYAWIYVYTLNTHGYTFIRWIRVDIRLYSLNVNEWKFHSPKEWNSCKPLKKRVVLYVKQPISTHIEWKWLQKEWISTRLRS